MTDKILSLASIKKCLESVKSWADRKFNDCYSNKGDYTNPDVNDKVNLGFYRYHGGITNGPDALSSTSDNYGLISNITNKDYISQLVFSLLSRNSQTICYRTGTTGNIASRPWLYFHGSTSPNIPVLKKTITGTTTAHGNLSLYPLTKANAIILAVTGVKNIDGDPLICSACTSGAGNWLAHFVSDTEPWPEVVSQEVSCVVYYLEIPPGYNIPDTTPASSDEPEDDMSVSPMENDAYE